MSLFRQGKTEEARKLVTDTAARMKPFPKDEKNPLAGDANHDDLILWLACKEASRLFPSRQPPTAPTPPKESEHLTENR